MREPKYKYIGLSSKWLLLLRSVKRRWLLRVEVWLVWVQERSTKVIESLAEETGKSGLTGNCDDPLVHLGPFSDERSSEFRQQNIETLTKLGENPHHYYFIGNSNDALHVKNFYGRVVCFFDEEMSKFWRVCDDET